MYKIAAYSQKDFEVKTRAFTWMMSKSSYCVSMWLNVSNSDCRNLWDEF